MQREPPWTGANGERIYEAINHHNTHHSLLLDKIDEIAPYSACEERDTTPCIRALSDVGDRAMLQATRHRSRARTHARGCKKCNKRSSSWPRDTPRHDRKGFKTLPKNDYKLEGTNEALKIPPWGRPKHHFDDGNCSEFEHFLAHMGNNIYEQNEAKRDPEIWQTDIVCHSQTRGDLSGSNGRDGQLAEDYSEDAKIDAEAHSDDFSEPAGLVDICDACSQECVGWGVRAEDFPSPTTNDLRKSSHAEEVGKKYDLGTTEDFTVRIEGLGMKSDTSNPISIEVPQDLYTPILPRQTRLLRLLPGASGHELSAELVVVDLLRTSGGFLPRQQAWVSYEAISYCWEDASASTAILCNGRTFPVTENVRKALSRLRRRHAARYLCSNYLIADWLDAICINQQDFVERSAQVSNMLSIYKKAARVVVWLGEHSALSGLVFHFLDRISPKHSELHSTPKSSLRVLRICQEHVDYLVKGLQEFIHHAWFHGASSQLIIVLLTVKQEVWAAENLDVVYADNVISWDALVAAWNWINELASSWPSLKWYRVVVLQSFVRPSVTERLWLTLRELPDPGANFDTNIVAVLNRTAGSECSDPRDRVYGILGMTGTNLTSNWTPHLTVDYHKAASEVFQDVVRYVMARDQNLDVLLLTDGAYGVLIAGEQLPSWCPNFESVQPTREWLKPIIHAEATKVRPIYKLAGSDEAVLPLEGTHIGTLDFSSMPALVEENSDRILFYYALSGLVMKLTIPPQCSPRIFNDVVTNDPVQMTVPGMCIAHDLVILSRSTGMPHVLRPRADGMYTYVGFAYVATAEQGIFTRTEHIEQFRNAYTGWSDWLLV
ncbi:hypothetical protein LTR56_009701 [Elasticomyces elasticus]|nr:hypothetical protein LTR56_009701 [Elasticomyces elasticus]KAK5752465.1 hypothetical protein LTS12_017501 [Elasticomyces elasticus]